MTYKKVKVNKGNGGWGGPLELKPTDKKKYVISVTGGGIHPVAKRVAELTGAEVVDAFKNPVESDETLLAVIDCGGTARSGTYPRMGIPTANVKVGSPSGPLSKFMTEDIFVSGVRLKDIELLGEETPPLSESEAIPNQDTEKSKTVLIHKDNNGWGGPLEITPDDEKRFVISVTGGGIHPVAKKLAELTGTTAVDAFESPVEADQTLAAIIDCGGTARCGTYPRLGIPTANVKVLEPSGPLSKYMTEDIFVSGVTVNSLEVVESAEESTISAIDKVDSEETDNEESNSTPISNDIPDEVSDQTATDINENPTDETSSGGVIGLVDNIGRKAGDFMNVMYQAGRDTIDSLIRNIIPFMAFVATLVGIINYSGIGEAIANVLTPLAGNIVGLFALGLITAIPFLSPLLAPGAVIAAVVGTLIGQQIAIGTIPPHLALPALFAINAQVGMDFIPVGMTLGEAEPETISYGTPAILFSRLITGPLAVLIAFAISQLM